MNPASRGVLLSCGIDRRDPDRMDDWFHILAARAELPPDVARELLERGFVVLPGPVASDRVAQWASACWRSDPRGAKRLAPLSGIARARSGTFQNASGASETTFGASKTLPEPPERLLARPEPFPEHPERFRERPKRFRKLRKDFWSIRNDFRSARNASRTAGRTFGASGSVPEAPEDVPGGAGGVKSRPGGGNRARDALDFRLTAPPSQVPCASSGRAPLSGPD